jgi:hypothetical protein
LCLGLALALILRSWFLVEHRAIQPPNAYPVGTKQPDFNGTRYASWRSDVAATWALAVGAAFFAMGLLY